MCIMRETFLKWNINGLQWNWMWHDISQEKEHIDTYTRRQKSKRISNDHACFNLIKYKIATRTIWYLQQIRPVTRDKEVWDNIINGCSMLTFGSQPRKKWIKIPILIFSTLCIVKKVFYLEGKKWYLYNFSIN